MSGCTILLLGPSGSGKFTSVRAACRRLHLHLVKVSFRITELAYYKIELKYKCTCISFYGVTRSIAI